MKIKTKHLFKMVTIVKKTGVLDKAKNFFGQAQGLDEKSEAQAQQELGIDIMMTVIGGIDKAEKEIYELLADIEGKKVKEIEDQDPSVTMASIKEVVGHEAFKGLLSSVAE